jgi:hypothetical protein
LNILELLIDNMKNNIANKGAIANSTLAIPNNEILGRANLQSRDMAAQPYIKLNVGQGNSFIVKNSNIVITSNTINKAVGGQQAPGIQGPIPILNSSIVSQTQGVPSGNMGDYT